METFLQSSIELAIKEDKTYSDWWKSVNGLFPRFGAVERDGMIRFCQTYWRNMNGKFAANNQEI